ncbi:IS110 family RNA-guided transposase [Candidatus Venteria ishoeyi]|uniref:Transposase IS116/IS110/IS902 family protein n=1 Tax=Candidatus Venteria ishoeyi TaxID=1899563 RepID=A0A1H6F5I4_9GAMM|nr:IS110 family transposase [Candidatus Venteria ishoeyi]SEH05362.1 Transposase IS116/IS110/IS902 family protein [Candidatus Venteria ishoeyi]
MARKKKIEMEIINHNAAGIDIGSKSHFVAIGQSLEDVKEFGVYAEDLVDICKWLLSYGITTVAMESTGDYWQNLYVELQKHGIEVVLCNGKFTKNAKGKKTDVKDSRWIQQLHSLGLLTGSFLPDETTEILRTYCRQRANWIDLAASATHKMQKYLKFLNFRLDVVVSDICGLTGMKIIDDICNGNLDPNSLAEHRHFNCKKPKEEIAKALHGNNRSDYIFGLKQEYESYNFFQKKIKACDKQIDKLIKREIRKNPENMKLKTSKKPHKKINKNSVDIKDFNQVAFQYFGGVDLMAIEGVSHATVMAIMSEIGIEGFKKFKTAKEFCSWLRLAPNNKISGGKILSNRIPKGSGRLKIALRQAANSIGNLKNTHMSDFFGRIAYRKGRQAAVSATARKLATVIWTMITKRVPYNPPTEYLFLDQKRKMATVKKIMKNMAKFDIKPSDIGLSNSLSLSQSF